MTAAWRDRAPTRHAVTVALLAAFVLPGCATKKDVRTLQMTISDMQAHQDSVLGALQRQQRLMLDTLRSSMALTLDTKGQTSHRFEELNSVIESTKQLNAQILETTRQLFARIDALEAKLQAVQAQPSQPPVAGTGGMTAAQAYDAGIRSMESGSYGSARTAFKAVIQQFHDEPQAAEAQFQIAQTYVAEESYREAYDAFALVASEWPTAPRAPEALYRAGKVAEDRKDWANARKYYNMVDNLYKKSDSAALARAALKKIPK